MPDSTVDLAHAFLRGHTRADLQFDENSRPIKYIIEPEGRLVAPVMVAMLQSINTVLFVPEFSDEAMQIEVSLEQFAETDEVPAPASSPGVSTVVSTGASTEGSRSPQSGGALIDRWRIHHGDPPDVQWAMFHLDAARYDGYVIDGDALRRENPLASVEPALCRFINEHHRAILPDLCRSVGTTVPDAGVMVAIDPGGIDIRGTFDVIRVAAPRRMTDEATARAVLEEMIGMCRS